MRRRALVAVPVVVLALMAARFARDGVVPVAHGAEEISADTRAFVAGELSDITAPADEPAVAPLASAAPAAVAPRAPAPVLAVEVVGSGGPAPSASAPLDAADTPETTGPMAGDVQAGIDAVANVDYDEAASKFRRACDHGSRFACGALGKLLATGTGLPKDVAQGRSFLRRGCSADEPWVCNHLRVVESEPAPR